MTTIDQDRELKLRQRGVWASGDYPKLADDLLLQLGVLLTQAAGVQPGHHVLDVATGSGNVAIAAAAAGAHVVASDLTPELLDAGRRRAAESGVELEWQEADAEALPFAAGTFDAVLSCLGVMFAPHHQLAADELVRVCRSGGTVGLLSWTPGGYIGQMFATMKPYAPPPPPGTQPPPLWGELAHVHELLGDRVDIVSAQTRSLSVDLFPTPEAFRDYFKSHYGPTIAVYRSLADAPERAAALDDDLAALARRHLDAQGSMQWEYLLVIARRT